MRRVTPVGIYLAVDTNPEEKTGLATLSTHDCCSKRARVLNFVSRSCFTRLKEFTYCISAHPSLSSPAGIGFLQLQLQFMALLQLLNLFFAFGGQFLELIDSIPHFGQSFLLIGADGIQRFHDIGKGSLQRLDRDIGFH